MAREIITTVERRRKWPDEVKLRIMSEALMPGVSTCAVADRNGVCRSLLYTWLRLAREGHLPGISLGSPQPSPTFVPVTVQAEQRPAAATRLASNEPAFSHASSAPAGGRRRVVLIEVRLANGRSVKVNEDIDPDVLARLVTALDTDARIRQDGAGT